MWEGSGIIGALVGRSGDHRGSGGGNSETRVTGGTVKLQVRTTAFTLLLSPSPSDKYHKWSRERERERERGMYAESPLQLSFLPGCTQEVGAASEAHWISDGWLLSGYHNDHFNVPPYMGNFMETATLLDYDLGGEGDLFISPDPIIEEPVLAPDPMTAAMSMITGGGDIATEESIEAVDLESVQNDPLLSEVFYEAVDLKSVQNDPLLSEVLYECTNDLLVKFAIEESLPELLDVQIPAVHTEENPDMLKNSLVAEGPIQKAVSSGSLTSSVWISGDMVKPNYIDFRVDLGDAFGMRRAYSEGDIQTLGNNNLTFDNMRTIQSSSEQLLTVSDFKFDNKIEERRQKLSRYRKKKSKRNFGRKIKYACRKALADSQPRVRGRFAKTEDYEAIKLQR